jgi:hypothetical protein
LLVVVFFLKGIIASVSRKSIGATDRISLVLVEQHAAQIHRDGVSEIEEAMTDAHTLVLAGFPLPRVMSGLELTSRARMVLIVLTSSSSRCSRGLKRLRKSSSSSS